MSHSYEMQALVTVLEKKGVPKKTEIIEEIQALQQR